MQRRSDHRTL